MKITSADVYSCDVNPANGNWIPVLLRLRTDEGIEGVGELALAYGTGSEAGVGMLKQMAERYVLNADPMRIEAMWHTLFRRTFWGQGGGPVVYGAMSAIDMALWDIKGKALGVPVCGLLGGPVSDTLRVYANGWYTTRTDKGRRSCGSPEEYAEAAEKVVADGYNAMKFDPFAVRADGVWDYPERLLTKERADLAYARVAAVRDAVGPDVDILVEVHGNLGTTSAIEFGRRIADLRPFFYEEPVDAMNVEAMLKVSQNVPVPIAAGERLYTRYGFREYIEKQALDILQPDMGLAGGISEVKKIAAYAETYDIHVQPHNCAGPVSTAAAVQLDACITNFVIQEWFPYRTDGTYELVEEALEPKAKDSTYTLPDTPGLGVTLNEQVVNKYLAVHVE
jgi:galactonate dehydratase